MNLTNLKSKKFCCGLFIPGSVPKSTPQNEEHIKFLKFVDNLKTHNMFFNNIEK